MGNDTNIRSTNGAEGTGAGTNTNGTTSGGTGSAGTGTGSSGRSAKPTPRRASKSEGGAHAASSKKPVIRIGKARVSGGKHGTGRQPSRSAAKQQPAAQQQPARQQQSTSQRQPARIEAGARSGGKQQPAGISSGGQQPAGAASHGTATQQQPAAQQPTAQQQPSRIALASRNGAGQQQPAGAGVEPRGAAAQQQPYGAAAGARDAANQQQPANQQQSTGPDARTNPAGQQQPARAEGEGREDAAQQQPSRMRGSSKHGGEKPVRKHKRSAFARLVNNWWNRLLNVVYHGSFSDQEAEYLEHETTRDYIWNTIGQGIWGGTLPILTIIATQLLGTEEAGMLSTAIVGGTLLMIVSNFGVRNFQASDIYENISFSAYHIHRWITAGIALLCGILYCMIRGYEPYMFTITMGVYVFKIIDGLADVYEGRLQQADKLYLAGVSMTVRCVFVIVIYTVIVVFTRNLAAACVGMAVGALVSLFLVSLPLAMLETDKSKPWKVDEVGKLFRQCFPLFFSLFMFTLIDSMPKFAIENMLTYDDQFYFNVLYYAAQGNTTFSALVYKPLLLRLADIWSNPKRRKRFDLIVVAMFLVIAGVAVVSGIFLGWIGIPIMGFIYGVDLEPYRDLFYVMTAAGAFNASIDFIYAVVTVLRHQGSITMPSIVAFICSCIIPTVMIYFMGLAGAVYGYLIVMAVLLVLLLREYVLIRGKISHESRSPFK